MHHDPAPPRDALRALPRGDQLMSAILGNRAQWTAALDVLELNLRRVQDWLTCVDSGACGGPEFGDCSDLEELAVLVMDDDHWRVRDGLPGQIPAELVPRAQSIAIRQSTVRADLRDRVAHVHAVARVTRPGIDTGRSVLARQGAQA